MPHPAGRPALPQSALTIGLIALLAFVVEILVEHLIGKPLEQAAPHVSRWWLMRKWTVQDRYGNEIYLTQERWEHVLRYRAELAGLLDDLLEWYKKWKSRPRTAGPFAWRTTRRATSWKSSSTTSRRRAPWN